MSLLSPRDPRIEVRMLISRREYDQAVQFLPDPDVSEVKVIKRQVIRDVSLPEWRPYFESEKNIAPHLIEIDFERIPAEQAAFGMPRAYWRLARWFKVL